MASILTNISKNKNGDIVRGVRILRSKYDKKTRRDSLKYLGTIPQGTTEIPKKISDFLSSSECQELTSKLQASSVIYLEMICNRLHSQLIALQQKKEILCEQMRISANTLGDNNGEK